MVKRFTQKEVDAMIVLRYRFQATTVAHPAFVTYDRLGKAFKCSGSHVRRLIMKR